MRDLGISQREQLRREEDPDFTEVFETEEPFQTPRHPFRNFGIGFQRSGVTPLMLLMALAYFTSPTLPQQFFMQETWGSQVADEARVWLVDNGLVKDGQPTEKMTAWIDARPCHAPPGAAVGDTGALVLLRLRPLHPPRDFAPLVGSSLLPSQEVGEFLGELR